MATVDIVMATYNGSKFLFKQIESLRSQTFSDWRLLITDDGSSDQTIAIIQKFVEQDARIHLVAHGRAGGVVKNFLRGLGFVDAPYVMFCDQDDIWESEKIELSIDCLRKIEVDPWVPSAVFTDLTLVDSDNQIIDSSFYGSTGLNPFDNLKLNVLSWRSSIYGCTLIFNGAALKCAMPFPNAVPMHDSWIALCVLASKGNLHYFPVSRIRYRQHGENLVGGGHNGFLLKLLKFGDRARRIRKGVRLVRSQNMALEAKFRPNFQYKDNFVGRIQYVFRALILNIFRGKFVFSILTAWYLLFDDEDCDFLN